VTLRAAHLRPAIHDRSIGPPALANVTGGAGHACVRGREREARVAIVIEARRGREVRRDMTGLTRALVRPTGELRSVRCGVAAGARARCRERERGVRGTARQDEGRGAAQGDAAR